MRLRLALLLGLLICATPVEAQTVQQSGSVTANHVATWKANGVIGDGGAVTANQSLMGGSSTSTASGTTIYCASQGCAATAANASTVSFTGTLANLQASVATAPGAGQTVTVTLYTGAYGSLAATTLTCTISGTNKACSDASHQVNLPAGTAWAIQFVTSGSAAGTGGQVGSAQMVSTGPPQPTSPYVLQSGQVTSGHQAVWTTNGVVQDGGVPVTSAIAPGPFTSGDLVYVNSLLQLADSGIVATRVVVGPAGATSGNFLSFNGTGGNLAQDSGVASSILATPGAATLVGNPTNATAAAQAFTIQGLAADSSPNITNDYLLIFNSAGGGLGKINLTQLGSLNTLCTTAAAFPIYNGAWVCSTAGGAGSAATLNGGPLTINPTASTFNQGITITQSGPTSGTTTVTAGENFNAIVATHSSTVTCASNTNPFAASGFWCNAVTGFKVGMVVGGSNVSAGPGAAGGTISPIIGHVINTVAMNTINDLVGIGGIAYSSSTNSGNGGLFGGATAVVCDGCAWNQVSGFEIDIGFINSPTVNIRTGLDIVAQNSTARGAVLDTAVWVVASNSSGNFNRLISVAGTPAATLSTTADVITFDGAMTINNFVNAAGACSGTAPAQGPCNVTVTGKILNFPFVTIAGGGVSQFGASGNSTGNIQINPVADGTSAGTNLSIFNAAGTTNPNAGTGIAILANEASRTTVRYGITLGNYAEIFVGNSAANGFILGTNTNIPIIFGTNNAFEGAIQNKQWNIGPSVALQANTKVTLNFNTAAPAAYAGAVRVPLQVVGVDTQNNAILNDTFSTLQASSFLTLRRARGTLASFSAVQSGDTLGDIGFVGAFNTTTFASVVGDNGGVFIQAQASENWNSTNQGAKLQIFTTLVGTNTIALNATFGAGLAVGSAAVEPGAGLINATTGYRIANAATSGHYLRGNGTNYVDAALAAADLTGQVAVANGGTACAAASITCFNNITGFSAAGTTGTTSTNLVFSTSPTITTPTFSTTATGSFGGTSNLLMGATSNYNIISLNNTLTIANTVGILGGAAGDASTLYLTAPTGGAVVFFFNGSSSFFASSTVFRPSTTNTVSLGQAGNLWSALFVTLANSATTSAVCYNVATGAFTYDGTIGTCTISGRQFKNPLGTVLDADSSYAIAHLSSGFWSYKDEKQFGAGVRLGLYADDVCEIDERACVRDADGRPQNYDERAVIGWLVGAWNDQRHKIETLKADNDNMRIANDNFRRQIDRLRRRVIAR